MQVNYRHPAYPKMSTDDVDMLRQAKRVRESDETEKLYAIRQRAANNYINLIKDCALATNPSRSDPVYSRIDSRLDFIANRDDIYSERIRQRAKALIGADPKEMLTGTHELIDDLRTPSASPSEAVHYDPVPDFIRHADALAVSAYAYRANPISKSNHDDVIYRVASLMTPITFAGNVSVVVPRSVAFLRLREHCEQLGDMNARCGELVAAHGQDGSSASSSSSVLSQITMLASNIVAFAFSLIGEEQDGGGGNHIGGKGGENNNGTSMTNNRDSMLALVQRLYDQTRTIETMVKNESYFAASGVATITNNTCELLRAYKEMQETTHSQRLLVIGHAIRCVNVTPDTMGVIEDDKWKQRAHEQSELATRQVVLLANAIGFRLELPPSQTNPSSSEEERGLSQLAHSFRNGEDVDRERARAIIKLSTEAIESDEIKAESKALRKRLRHDSATAEELADLVEHLDLSIETNM